MSIVSDIFSAVESVCECVFAVGHFLCNAAKKVSQYVKGLSEEYRAPIKGRDSREVMNDVSRANDEIADLQRKKNRDRSLNSRDEDRLHELNQRRSQLRKEKWESRTQKAVNEIRKRESDLSEVLITPDHTHILQYHIGLDAAGKKCLRCGKDMILQFPQGLLSIRQEGLFWGCTGYFGGSCTYTEQFIATSDCLVTPDKVEEFTIDQNTLATLYANSRIQAGAARRLSEHRREAVDGYECPVHLESLVVREKHDFVGALDQFFLACPRWKGDSPESCRYKVKLKSPAQLAAVLNASEGRGIL